MINAIASATGLAILFEVIPASLTVVRYLGAAYLLYLAYKTLTARISAPVEGERIGGRYFSQAMIVSLLNPKVTLFFAAFLPSFIDPAQGHFQQIFLLAFIFVVIALLFDFLIVLTSGLTRQYFMKSGGGNNRFFKYASATCLTIVAGFAIS